MKEAVHLLDVVALLEDLPDRGLCRGQVGTVVEELVPGVVEIEFCDQQGRTLACLAVPITKLLVLHYDAIQAA